MDLNNSFVRGSIPTANETSEFTQCACQVSRSVKTTCSGQMISLCIPCKRLARQKEKEAWLSSSANQEPVESAKGDFCVDTNETLLSIANKVLVSRLECPVCYQLMLPPLRQCRSGHSICSRCNARLNRCPTCRRSFIDTSNVILNEICLVVAIPCRYYQDGCRQLVRLVDKSDHEKDCQWRRYDCPETVAKCGWKGLQADIVDHLSKEHCGSISRVELDRNTTIRYTYGRIHPVEEVNIEIDHFDIVSRTLLLVDEWGEGRDAFVFSLKYDTACGSLFAVLRYLGAKKDALRYSYKVRLVSPDGSLRISTTTLCGGYDVSVDEVITAGRVMKVDGQVFNKFVGSDGKFFVAIKIFLREHHTQQDSKV